MMRLFRGLVHTLPFIIGLNLIVFCALPAVAQEGLGRGRVSGDVKDESGAAIEGAVVSAQSLTADAKLSSVR